MNTGKNISFCRQLAWIVAGFALFAGRQPPAAAEQFTPPDLEGFTQHSERMADGDADGIDETRIRLYLNPAGDSIVSMTTRDRLWAWSLDTRDDESGVHNYVIRDSDCDGVFDEVYGLDDEFHLPDCLK